MSTRKDRCHAHATRDATHVAMVRGAHGRHVYRMCDECAVTVPTARPLAVNHETPNRYQEATA